MRILVVNYAGDVRDAWKKIAAGENETYYAQKYSLESYAGLRQYADEVAVLTCLTQDAYNEEITSGFRTLGGGFHQDSDIDKSRLINLIESYNPTHLILCMINKGILGWAISHRVPAIAIFANSISAQSPSFIKGLVRKIKNSRLARLLNHPNIEWVGSYGINSSLELQRSGVNPAKIIPWDYLVDTDAGSLLPKTAPSQEKVFSLCYVGSISEDKGVGDLLEAIATLKAQSFPVHLKIIGADHANFAGDMIAKLNLADCVDLLGIVPNSIIESTMHCADLVVVPSRHQYPEGFPLVIHHALRACTPIVASDHPMFASHLQHRENAMIFPQGNALAMVDCIREVLTNQDLYQKISALSHPTWYKLRLPVKWADLAHRWASQTSGNRQWLSEHSLATFSQGRQYGEPSEQPAGKNT